LAKRNVRVEYNNIGQAVKEGEMHHILIFIGGVVIGYMATLFILDYMDNHPKRRR